MNVGNFLRNLRKKNKKTLKDVAQSIEASSSFISQIEKGIRNPSDKVLKNILTKAFNVSEAEADILISEWRIKTYGGDVFGKTVSLKARDKVHPEDLPQGAFWFDELPLLPFYKTIPQDFEESKPDTYWPFPIESPEMMGRLFIYQMYDESMEPHIPQGAFLVIDRQIEDIPYNSLILALTDGKAKVRYYEKREDKTKLVPANTRYPVYFGEDVKVLGKIVQMLIDI